LLNKDILLNQEINLNLKNEIILYNNLLDSAQNSKISLQLINISSSGEEIDFGDNLYSINKSCTAGRQQIGYKTRLRNSVKEIVPLTPTTQKAKALLTKVTSINPELGSTTLDSLAEVVADPVNEVTLMRKPGRKIRTGPAGRYRSNVMFSPKSGVHE
jgi:hypothetical protein